MSERTLPAFTVGASLLFLSLLVALAAIIQTGAAVPFDSFLRNRVHDFAFPGLTEAMSLVTLLGSPIVLGLLTILLFFSFRWAGRLDAASHLARVMIGAAILENALKFVFQRARPEPFFGIVSPETYSLPSGHALFSACFYGVVASEVAAILINGSARAATWASAVSLITAIGFSRIYLGVHFPTDVIAGYFVAAFWLNAVQLRPLRSKMAPKTK